MPLPVVVVVAPPPARVSAEAVLEKACEDVALAPCRVAAVEPHEGAFVSVVWMGQDEVRLEVRGAPASAEPSRARLLSFRPTDPPLDRWETIGLVAGALSAELNDVLGPPEPEEQVAPAEPWGAFPRGWLGMGVVVGTGLASDPPRLGSALDAGLGMGPLPLELALTASVASGQSQEGIGLRWIVLTPTVGTSVSWQRTGITLRARVGPHWHQLEARLKGPAYVGRAARWGGGVGGAVDLHWPSDTWSGWLGLEAWRLSDETAVIVDDVRLSRWPALGGTLRFGLSWTFGQPLRRR